MLPIYTKNFHMLFSLGQSCKNIEYSWQDQAHLLQIKGPLFMNDKLSAERNEHANNFAKVTVPMYSSLIMTRFKPS